MRWRKRLLGAEKVALERQLHWVCTGPYELEDWLRRQVQAHGITLLHVTHGEAVAFTLAGAEAAMHELRAQLDNARGGRLRWDDTDGPVTP